MQFVDKILFQINTEIEKLGIDDCMGIDSALHMMRFIQPLCDELRKYILAYQFADEAEEINFFKEHKPEVLSKYLFLSDTRFFICFHLFFWALEAGFTSAKIIN